MPPGDFTIAVVDDDTRLRESLGDLLESAGYSVRPFGSAKSFLEDEAALPGTDRCGSLGVHNRLHVTLQIPISSRNLQLKHLAETSFNLKQVLTKDYILIYDPIR